MRVANPPEELLDTSARTFNAASAKARGSSANRLLPRKLSLSNPMM